MNAQVRSFTTHTEPLRLGLPEAAWLRLRLRLGRGAATGEVLDASIAYGAPFEELSRLVERWSYDFELETQPVFALPSFTLQGGERSLDFVHARSSEPFAMPLLLLHGYAGSCAEFQRVIEPLTTPSAHDGSVDDAFHVVCPALFGTSGSAPPPSLRALAEDCAALMQQLGYSRYVVHGSDLGANLALELAALDTARVAGLHISALPAYPGQEPHELTSLTSHEKSQLARLSELYEELAFHLPESPIEALAFALTRIEPSDVRAPTWRESLLAGLTLSWGFGGAERRNQLYRGSRLAAAPPSATPAAVHCFPLDAPNLRRFAERRQRVVEWTEHELGGAMPALERPAELVSSLRELFARFR
jgi:pimeloyl-ACP methyl ester carboxylesterase